MTYYKLAFSHTDAQQPFLELQYFKIPHMTIPKTMNHISFTIDKDTSIIEIKCQMEKKGVKFKSEIPSHGDHNMLYFCEDFEGNLIELVQDIDTSKIKMGKTVVLK
jgi:hypothetical protein